jgi:hypothetical protein
MKHHFSNERTHKNLTKTLEKGERSEDHKEGGCPWEECSKIWLQPIHVRYSSSNTRRGPQEHGQELCPITLVQTPMSRNKGKKKTEKEKELEWEQRGVAWLGLAWLVLSCLVLSILEQFFCY